MNKLVKFDIENPKVLKIGVVLLAAISMVVAIVFLSYIPIIIGFLLSGFSFYMAHLHKKEKNEKYQ
jgi:hypothetical protein